MRCDSSRNCSSVRPAISEIVAARIGEMSCDDIVQTTDHCDGPISQ